MSAGASEPTRTAAVVICTRDRPAALARCVDSLLAMEGKRPEIIVVDDSLDGSLPEPGRGVIVVRSRGRGLSAARNAGTAVTDADVVAFVDDDAEVERAWLPKLLTAFADPRNAAASGRILPLSPDRVPPHDLFAEIGDFDLGPLAKSFDRSTPGWFEVANFGGIGYGGNMAFRRRVLVDLGGFPPWFGLGAPIDGCEESNLFFRLIDNSYAVAYVPDAIVLHPFPLSLEEVRERHIRDLRRVVAYLLYLCIDEPRYRREGLRYLLGALRREPRQWRGQTRKPGPEVADRRATVKVVAEGLRNCTRARRLRRSLASQSELG